MIMDKDNDFRDEETSVVGEGDFAPDTAPRARNRTVMLTPDITGQVRARLQQEMEEPQVEMTEQISVQIQQDQSDFAPVGRGRPISAEPAPVADYRIGRPLGGPVHSPAAGTPVREQTIREPAIKESAAREGITWLKRTKVVGFLVSYDGDPNGDVYELRVGRLLVSSEASYSNNCLVVKDDSVSLAHAILRVSQGGEIQVLDQLSDSGTKIKRFGSDVEQELSGEKSTLEHGDVVIFGKRKFHVCVIPVSNSAQA
jgi:hypothetical protein